MPSQAPGKNEPLINSVSKIMYGKVAVKYTTYTVTQDILLKKLQSYNKLKYFINKSKVENSAFASARFKTIILPMQFAFSQL